MVDGKHLNPRLDLVSVKKCQKWCMYMSLPSSHCATWGPVSKEHVSSISFFRSFCNPHWRGGGEGEGLRALRTGWLLYPLFLLMDILDVFGQVLTPLRTECTVWTLVGAFTRVGCHVALDIIWPVASEVTWWTLVEPWVVLLLVLQKILVCLACEVTLLACVGLFGVCVHVTCQALLLLAHTVAVVALVLAYVVLLFFWLCWGGWLILLGNKDLWITF